ncbi:hypothetical protein EV198_1536 [Roseivirga ehrenbergii]|uniref:DUF4221 domain-containing protein n=2 Tax=Roseivirga ehrenbergii (strain DSM 102268 / JCM 13514 / KCTC 12282 / NCIMB 14502 / KMM 6017) TaxID=279360 RepID=A0A150XRP5_ROSEK|nr:hypothetical protein MB14_12255 [Roseivirga ehrenbergii]TCL10506.1 hypothetical protein EV198_1536 [Roseivirga ehrenbergii]
MKANHFKSLGIAIFSTFAIVSCSSNSSTESENSNLEGNYELVKVDSLMVPVLEPLQITDFNPKTNRFLAYGTQSKACMEIDAEGNVLSSVDLTGEGPGHFGPGMSGLGYLGDNIVVEGAGAYYFFDADWNYLEKFTPGSGYIPLSYISGKPDAVEINGVNTVIKAKSQNYNGNVELKEGHFNTAMMLEAFNSKSQEPTELLPYPENSIYRTSELYFDGHEPKISYNKQKEELILMLPLEPKMYKYELKNNRFEFVSTSNLDLKNFRTPQGIPYEDQHKNPLKNFGRSNELNYVYRVLNSSILDVNSYGEITMIRYKTGAKEPTNIIRFEEALKYAKSESETLYSFFVKDKMVLETDIDLGRYVRLSETQFLVPYVNEEEELDYNKFYIYELKKVK